MTVKSWMEEQETNNKQTNKLVYYESQEIISLNFEQTM